MNLNNILPILLLIVVFSLFAVCIGIFTTALAKKKLVAIIFVHV
ncbi:hypothetical protein [Terrisporobacter othiniensis]|nr:hypothetical protein [Terrisporobacter othiniensis]